MLRWMAAALLVAAFVPAAGADTKPTATALEEAMSGLFVVVPTNPETGAAMMAKLPAADGKPEREVVVAFLDAADAAREVKKAGMQDKVEGRLFNGAALMAIAKGDILWRTSADNAVLVNGTETRPPAFYITGPDDEPMTQPVEGKARVVFYVDAVAADSARVAAQNELSAAGKPTDLSVVAADLVSLIDGVKKGEAKDVYIASSPTVIIWAAQWEQGKRLIRDYSPN
ncbi:hypothetical protein [Hyphomonas sp.]|jgi:hypothetical protein|uniref:hypothetical protein n=1 Tax=Hyphomonas sp. TaxID=87 RepID=UPI0025BC223B|nr:hypothetical protein [Hyphomonas sp.]MBI1398830.1 hypothetical protein [Hyphomonas sp.]